MGSRYTGALTLPQREAVYAVFKAIEGQQGLTEARRLAAAAAGALLARAQQPRDLAAQSVVRLLVQEGCYALVEPWLSARRSTIVVRPGGPRPVTRSVREVVSVRRPGPPDAPGATYQLALWWTITWDEFEAMLRRYRAQGVLMLEQATAWEEVLQLREAYPATATPGDACAAAGIDPQSFVVPTAPAG